MATSNSTDFSLTAREVITFALKKLRVIGQGQTATASQADDAMEQLNLLLKSWQRHENLWRLTEGSVALIADTANYTLSPNPYRVISARYDDQATEIPMHLLTREEYFDFPLKTNTGIPTQYYVDYQRATTVLYVWPVMASVTDETVNYTYLRRFEDVDSLDNDLDVRQEWLEVVGFNLAARLLDDYGRTGEVVNRIIARADYLLEQMLDDDRPDEVRFTPGYMEMGG